MKPIRKDAYQLFHEGALALADAERYGMTVNVDYCRNKLTHLQRQAERTYKNILTEPEIIMWSKKYGDRFNLNSDDQLQNILYKELNLTPLKSTDKYEDDEENKKGSVDFESLSTIKLPFINKLLELRKSKTAQDDLNGILREQVNGIIHPNFTLHFANSYRSSCRDPNLQNMPIRDPQLGKTIRQAFIPRPGACFGELDYGGIEVHGASWYHHDPAMIEYLSDSTKDMHRDMSAQIYKLESAPPGYWKDKATGSGSIVRYCGKNRYVFPVFYGSYYVECAKNLWRSIDDMHLVDPTGRPLMQHLKSEGIGTFTRFEKHIQDVEKDFWGRRFKVYSSWKDEWYDEYQKKGYFDTLTGFQCKGFLRKNQVINYPPQGTAFHCLLWSFTQISKELKIQGFKSRAICQIHDSIILNLYPEEINRVMQICEEIMIYALKDHWEFITTPITIEAEISPVDQTWHDKKVVSNSIDACSCGIEYLYMVGGDVMCPACGIVP